MIYFPNSVKGLRRVPGLANSTRFSQNRVLTPFVQTSREVGERP